MEAPEQLAPSRTRLRLGAIEPLKAQRVSHVFGPAQLAQGSASAGPGPDSPSNGASSAEHPAGPVRNGIERAASAAIRIRRSSDWESHIGSTRRCTTVNAGCRSALRTALQTALKLRLALSLADRLASLQAPGGGRRVLRCSRRL
jgi:hypothetical protein